MLTGRGSKWNVLELDSGGLSSQFLSSMSNCLIVLIAVIDIPHKSHIIKRLHSKQRSHHDDDHKNMWQNTFMNLLRAPQFRGQSSTKLSGLGR